MVWGFGHAFAAWGLLWLLPLLVVASLGVRNSWGLRCLVGSSPCWLVWGVHLYARGVGWLHPFGTCTHPVPVCGGAGPVAPGSLEFGVQGVWGLLVVVFASSLSKIVTTALALVVCGCWVMRSSHHTH